MIEDTGYGLPATDTHQRFGFTRWRLSRFALLALLVALGVSSLPACGVRGDAPPAAMPTATRRGTTFIRRAAPVLGMVVDRQSRVVAVDAGGVAERSGIMPGDRLLALDGVAVPSSAEWRRLVQQAGESRALNLTVERGGQTVIVTVTPGNRAGQPGQLTPTPVPNDLVYF